MSGKKVWFCAGCGYEVTSRGRCFRCRERLVASPLAELPVGAEDDEVGYRLGDWEPAGRGRLIVALIRANVEHRFDDEELIVAADDEARTDDLLAELQTVLAVEAAAEGSDTPDEDGLARVPPADGGDTGPGDDVVVDEEMTARDERALAAVEQLYGAAKRLLEDPTDMEADADVAEASAGVFGTEEFYGVDVEGWAAVGRVTRRLLGALGADEALEDEIRTQAGVLVKLLGPLVDPTAATPTGHVGAGGSSTRDLLAESTAALPEGRRDHGAAPPGEHGDPTAAEPGDGDTGDGADEIVYELPDWLPEQRANLSVMLDAAGIPHSWDGGDLVVAGAREGDVDALFDRIEAGQATGGDDEGHDRYRALEELFAAADRLANDPESDSKRSDAARAVAAADGPTPVGLADVEWWQLRARARGLVDAIDMGAGSTRVHDEATAVRDLLRAIV
ncbi:MAG TPA: hypothetical protein VG184_04285 [Acidimicrobiales bacterium]|nr:hypothetical protein [Acidimicrobiales bacterium]